MKSDPHQKVQASHLKRNAYLYIRQSTLRQVFENTESTKRQYALRQRAVALGWSEDRIIVIDSDLGQSGASSADREGFQRLVAEVGVGHAGIVLDLEVSRLARNSTDWHRLLEICAITDTLILDEDGVYERIEYKNRPPVCSNNGFIERYRRLVFGVWRSGRDAKRCATTARSRPSMDNGQCAAAMVRFGSSRTQWPLSTTRLTLFTPITRRVTGSKLALPNTTLGISRSFSNASRTPRRS
jgi:hypothetical protein